MAKRPIAVTAKSHKSHKTDAPEPVHPESQAGSDSGPSSTALAITLPSDPSTDLTEKPRGDAAPGAEAGKAVLPFVEPEPKKQWWWRPADSKARKMLEKVLVMDAAGHPDKAIAKKLGTTTGTIQQCRYIGRKNGWVRSNEDGVEEVIDLELELAMDVDRKVVRNISASLDGQMTNWQTHEMTIAAAKGRGMFKNHEVAKNEGPQTLPVVAIQVIMPAVGAGDQLPQVQEDQMGGVPAFIDGDTIDDTSENS